MDIKSENITKEYLNSRKEYHRNLKKEYDEERKKMECTYCGTIGCLHFIDMCKECNDFDKIEYRWWNNSKLKEQSKKVKEAYKTKLILKDIFLEKRDKLLKKQSRTTRDYKIAVFRRKQKTTKEINKTTKKYKNDLKDYIKNI